MLYKKDLHNYQTVSAEHIINHNHAGLFLDMGLGKTVSTLTAIEELIFDYLTINKVLIIAPKRVSEHVWGAEVKKWNHLKHLRVSVITGTEKQRKAALKTEADIYTIARDNTAWLCGQYGGLMLPFDMLVLDESSSFKNSKSVRFKALKMVQPSFKRVVLLTGTPSPNGLIDLWAQIYLLDRGDRLGKFITGFRTKYFTPGASKGHVVYKYNIQKGSEEQIRDKIKDICISMKAKDYLSLPQRTDNYIEVELPSKIQEQYDDFEREKVLELVEATEEGEPISATNAAALSGKLRQFANGAVYDEAKEYHVMHDEKLNALDEIMEGLGGKSVIVAWAFRHDLYRILGKFKKYKPVQLSKPSDIDDWNAGKIQMLLMHPQSGGHGLNLQFGGSTIVHFGLNWSLELYLQMNARVDRQGQKEKTIIHHIVTKNTIEADVRKALQNKEKAQDSLMQAVKYRISKYVK